MAVCKQYYTKQGWRPPFTHGVQASEAQGGPSTKIWDTDDLSNGDKSHSEGPPMGNRSPACPQESPLTVDGLPRECELISFNSFS